MNHGTGNDGIIEYRQVDSTMVDCKTVVTKELNAKQQLAKQYIAKRRIAKLWITNTVNRKTIAHWLTIVRHQIIIYPNCLYTDWQSQIANYNLLIKGSVHVSDRLSWTGLQMMNWDCKVPVMHCEFLNRDALHCGSVSCKSVHCESVNCKAISCNLELQCHDLCIDKCETTIYNPGMIHSMT